MRCDQNMDITDEAEAFLQENQLIPLDLKTIGHYLGMFMDKYPLFRFKLKDGGYADQYLQAHPWSSGPVAFIGLKVFDKNGNSIKTFKWSQEDIDNA